MQCEIATSPCASTFLLGHRQPTIGRSLRIMDPRERASLISKIWVLSDGGDDMIVYRISSVSFDTAGY